MINPIAVLPVRLDSTRVPRKALAEIAGKPLLWHVWQQVVAAGCFRQVVIVTSEQSVIDLVDSWGGAAILTSGAFNNGTERIGSIASVLRSRHIVNVQADMPVIEPRLFHELLEAWSRQESEVITPIYRLNSSSELFNPNIVKVARAQCGTAIYFSRQPIPFLRDWPKRLWLEQGVYWGHIGIYGVTTSALKTYCMQEPSAVELAESLEQLRFIEATIPINTFETQAVPMRVDGLSDLVRARKLMSPTDAAAPNGL